MTVASRVAVEVAERLGLSVDQPVLIQETNNTVLWLRPHAIIAKVATRRDSIEGAIRSHRIATALGELGGEVALPAPEIPPVRDPGTGFLVTLWQRLEHDPNVQLPERAVGRSLGRLHDALAACDVPLPSFRLSLERARYALADDGAVAALAGADREFLRAAFDAMFTELEEHDLTERVLHGEPHDANYVISAEGLRWIDFESACRGPLEWDLAFLSPEARAAFPEPDVGILELLQALNSARVATWCWVQYRFPEMRWHAQHHLEVVRRRCRERP